DLAVAVRRQPVTVGVQTMVGELGEVRGDGQVFVRGELWWARPVAGEQLSPGERVRVEHVGDGLVLDVRPVERLDASASVTA
ncbi:MAG: hypothetical protein LC685_02605, partial [Actinobacteria bacterium]|nr:hypothetical protein [Actinomycetota bacterium]